MEGRASLNPPWTSRAGTPERACPRSSPIGFVPGQVVNVRIDAPHACRIVVSTVVTLRGDVPGRLDPNGQPVARDLAGRYFTPTGRGQIAVWRSDGQFERSIGRLGDGRGELAPGYTPVHVSPTGRLFVRDNNYHWTVFSRSLELVDILNARGMSADPLKSTFLDDGRFLATQSGDEVRKYYLQLFDLDGVAERTGATGASPMEERPRPVAEFGRIETKAMPQAWQGRAVALGPAASFWVGSTPSASGGYQLELWRSDGTRVLTLRRTATWFARDEHVPNGAPLPQVRLVGVDSSGLLYVETVVPNAHWRRDFSTLPPRAELDMADAYVDVLDSRAGVLLASTGRVSGATAYSDYPHGFFPRSDEGYVNVSGGPIRAVRIVKYQLVGR